MKKIFMILVVALMASGMVMAQGARRGDKRPDAKTRAERMTERMVKEYSLNDTQKQQVYEANLALTEKMGDMPMHRRSDMKGDKKCNKVEKGEKKQMTDAERKEMKVDREKKREEMKAAREAYDVQMKKIMTKEQFDAYSKKQSERRAHPAKRRG